MAYARKPIESRLPPYLIPEHIFVTMPKKCKAEFLRCRRLKCPGPVNNLQDIDDNSEVHPSISPCTIEPCSVFAAAQIVFSNDDGETEFVPIPTLRFSLILIALIDLSSTVGRLLSSNQIHCNVLTH